MGEDSLCQNSTQVCEPSTCVSPPPTTAIDPQNMVKVSTKRDRSESTNSDIPETLSAKDYLKQREKHYEDGNHSS